MFNLKIKSSIILLLVLSFNNIVFAQLRKESNIIYSNIDSPISNNIDKIINNLFYKGKCIGKNKLARMYDKDKLSIDIIRDAFLLNKKSSINLIENYLIDYKDQLDSDDALKPTDKQYIGLDGIIVYSSDPQPRLMRLTTPRNYKHNIKTFYIRDIKNKKDIEEAFCKSIPPVTEGP